MLELRSARTVRALVLLAVLVLLAPAVRGLATADTDHLSRVYGRALAALPGLPALASDPMAALRQTVGYLRDRVSGVLASAALTDRVRHEWLGDPGAPTLVRNGAFVFLTRHDAATRPRFNAMAFTCLAPSAPGDWPATLVENMARVHAGLARPDRRIGFLIVPSKPVLYFDRLPVSVPADLRAACARTALANAGLGHWQHAMAERGLTAAYPLRRLQSQRDRPHFYPPGNYHSEGAAAHVAAWALLERMYPGRFRPGSVPMRVERGRADMRNMLTHERAVRFLRPQYGPATPARSREAEAALARRWPGVGAISVYRTPAPRVGGRAVVIGNSFSVHVAPEIAPGFAETVRINVNGTDDAGRRRLLTAFLDSYAPDAVIFVHHDGGMKISRFAQYANVL